MNDKPGKNKSIALFDAKPYDREFFDAANSGYGYSIKYINNHLNEETVDLARGYDAICAFVNDVINAPVLEALHSYGIELIALRSAGYNNVDFEAAYGKVHVVRVPDYSPYAVAEHAAALMLSLNRKIHRAFNRTRDLNFNINGLLGWDIHGKTAGVIGTGKIGKEMIRILCGFGMKVLAYDVYPDPDFAGKAGFSYVELDTLYRESDLITLHCPLTKETFHMINADSISRMKDGVMIINTSRGHLIDTVALIDALKTGKIGSAGLDVYEEESAYFFEDYSTRIISDDVLARLLTFPNVLVTSHQGFFTREALVNITHVTLQNIADFFAGRELKNEVCYQCDKHPCPKEVDGRCF